MRIISIITLVFVMVFCGCYESGSSLQPGSEAASISGIVKDGVNYDPISNVTVSTMPPSSSVLTGQDGSFFISDKVETDTVYQIKLSKHGYLSNTQMISVDKGEVSIGEMTLERDYVNTIWLIAIVKRASDDSVVADAELEIAYAGGTEQFKTNTNGIINTVLNIPKGSSSTTDAIVSIRYDGSLVYSDSCTLEFGDTNNVTFSVDL